MRKFRWPNVVYNVVYNGAESNSRREIDG